MPGPNFAKKNPYITTILLTSNCASNLKIGSSEDNLTN